MYITISPQKLGDQYAKSVRDFVQYLEKENLSNLSQKQELFFNQTNDHIVPETVIREIDSNTTKLKSTEPRYYSLTVNPSQRELQHINSDPSKLKMYVRELMKEYAASFNREINGKPVHITDIKYFAKIEYNRNYKGHDKEIRENTPFLKMISKLQNDIRKISRGELSGSTKSLEREIRQLQIKAPHRVNDKMIIQGMQKPGNQMHVHIIVSRKDQSNSVSLSPGSKYKASEVVINGRTVKRGFNRDSFFEKAEKKFDKQFNFNRSFVEKYASRKVLQKSPKQYYTNLLKLPVQERKLAMQFIKASGIELPRLPISRIPSILKQIQKAISLGIKSSSIGY